MRGRRKEKKSDLWREDSEVAWVEGRLPTGGDYEGGWAAKVGST